MIRIVEAIQGYLKHLNESLAECASAVSDIRGTLALFAESNHAIGQKMGEMFDQQREQNDRINRYLYDQAQKEREDAKLRAEVERLRSEVREVQGKRAANG